LEEAVDLSYDRLLMMMMINGINGKQKQNYKQTTLQANYMNKIMVLNQKTVVINY
jgi:hypothetical protein